MEMELNFESQKIIAVPVGEESIIDLDLKAQLESIPSRMAFKIGEVADLVDVKPYILRYWETEFEIISPKKSKHNQRMYERKDVEYLLIIKKLLYKDKYSIEGAKAALKRYRKQGKKAHALLESSNLYETMVERAQRIIQQADFCLQIIGEED